MEKDIPAIDFSAMDFPSDRLIVRAIRTAFPSSFDIAGHPHQSSRSRCFGRASVGAALDGVIDAERLVASIAFRRTAGQELSEDESSFDRREIIDALTTDYLRLGLATGKLQVVELVRQIEAQAIEQAHNKAGRGGPAAD
jgi:hypothetical protein